jgi:hypothetical protein
MSSPVPSYADRDTREWRLLAAQFRKMPMDELSNQLADLHIRVHQFDAMEAEMRARCRELRDQLEVLYTYVGELPRPE